MNDDIRAGNIAEPTTTNNHDADVAITLSFGLTEAAVNIVEATCDEYVSSLRQSFEVYRKKYAAAAAAAATDVLANMNTSIALFHE